MPCTPRPSAPPPPASLPPVSSWPEDGPRAPGCPWALSPSWALAWALEEPVAGLYPGGALLEGTTAPRLQARGALQLAPPAPPAPVGQSLQSQARGRFPKSLR